MNEDLGLTALPAGVWLEQFGDDLPFAQRIPYEATVEQVTPMNGELRQFLNHLHRGGAYSYWWTSEGKRSHWWPVDQPSPVPPDRLNVYFGVHPVTRIPPVNSRGEPKPPEAVRSQLEYIAAINCLFAEFDAEDFGGSKEATLAHIQGLPIRPSVSIDSGGGYHCYWLLDEPFMLDTDEQREWAKRLQEMWVEFVGGDRGAKDLARVLRVPGTRNFKEKYAPDFPLVTFVSANLDQVYRLGELEAVIRIPETGTTWRTDCYTSGDLDAQGTTYLERSAPSRRGDRSSCIEKGWKIPRLAWRLLRGDAATVSRYKSRSEAESALIASLIKEGHTRGQILELMIKHPGPGKFRELYLANTQKALYYFDRTYDSELEFVKSNPGRAKALASQLMETEASRPWPGRTGATDRAVFIAHLRIVMKCGKDPHAASVRELAELAGVDARTAARANRRLVEADRLELIEPAEGAQSAVWQLIVPELSLDASLHHSSSIDRVGQNEMNTKTPAMQPDHDAFRWSGLGKTGADIFYALQARGEASVTELVEATGRARSTVSRKLKKMTNLSMAEPVGRGRWRALDVNLDVVARILGTAGKGRAQRAWHREERRWYRKDRRIQRKCWGLGQTWVGDS